MATNKTILYPGLISPPFTPPEAEEARPEFITAKPRHEIHRYRGGVFEIPTDEAGIPEDTSQEWEVTISQRGRPRFRAGASLLIEAPDQPIAAEEVRPEFINQRPPPHQQRAGAGAVFEAPLTPVPGEEARPEVVTAEVQVRVHRYRGGTFLTPLPTLDVASEWETLYHRASRPRFRAPASQIFEAPLQPPIGEEARGELITAQAPVRISHYRGQITESPVPPPVSTDVSQEWGGISTTRQRHLHRRHLGGLIATPFTPAVIPPPPGHDRRRRIQRTHFSV